MSVSRRLKHARQQAGLTGAQVGERTGVGPSSLSDFENDNREPSLSQLTALARVYNVSLSFLLDEGEIPREAVLWRERPAEPAELETRFLQLCRQYHNLETWCNERATSCLPSADGTPQRFEYPHAEKLAKDVRDKLQLGDRPAWGLLHALEELCAVKVFHLPFEPTGTAASTWSDTFGAAVLLNSANARWRRNHDLAHELFHLLTWNIFRAPADSQSCTPGEEEEKLATCFAVNLLMPADATKSALTEHIKDNALRFDKLFDIAREFDVSVESLLWRIHFLYRKQEHKSITEKDIQNAKELAPTFEEREESEPRAFPGRYHALAVKALRGGEMSIGRFAEYLDISRQQAMKRYVEQEIADREEVQVSPA